MISNDGRALLADFGFSYVVNSSFNMDIPCQNEPKGTMNWMSPELFDGSGVSAEADVWAFGMTTLVRSSSFFHVKLKKIPTGTIHTQSPFLSSFQVVLSHHVFHHEGTSSGTPNFRGCVFAHDRNVVGYVLPMLAARTLLATQDGRNSCRNSKSAQCLLL